MKGYQSVYRTGRSIVTRFLKVIVWPFLRRLCLIEITNNKNPDKIHIIISNRLKAKKPVNMSCTVRASIEQVSTLTESVSGGWILHGSVAAAVLWAGAG